ncbi:hypothetical protein GCM10025868_34060 [Angustibacter aerolatus]|uniref:Uncharacterized protein n=1 Tax=Angustibacter aerolatus TaxID=1162965 RepID=A0ABQ6JKS1_9ACTN|nr:hypothetical protein [Angustibacter aerolatus]GMA88156.1 hypothetical protein GCM10025868_34060 [Angustibacter aerolatus]
MGLLDRHQVKLGGDTSDADAHAQTVARYRGLLLHEIDLGEPEQGSTRGNGGCASSG